MEKQKNKIFIKIFLHILLLAWMFTIFIFSNQPANQSDDLSTGVSYKICKMVNSMTGQNWSEETMLSYAQKIDYPVRKAAHMTEYAILAVIAWLAVSTWTKKKIRYPISLVICFLYASTDEFHQLYVQGRSGKFTDVLIDTSGALIALVIVLVIVKLHQLRIYRRKKV